MLQLDLRQQMNAEPGGPAVRKAVNDDTGFCNRRLAASWTLP